MIVGQAKNDQAGHLPFALESLQLGDETVGPTLVAVLQVETAKQRIEVSFQALDPGMPGSARLRTIFDELAVTAIADARLAAAVPQVSAGGNGDGRVAFGRILEAGKGLLAVHVPVPIDQRPNLLDIIGRIGGRAPFVAVGTDFAVDVEIVQEHELPGQGVMIGRDALRKDAKVRIAVALADVAEYLVVGPVFLDDIDAMLDRAGLADFGRYRIVGLAGAARGSGSRPASGLQA